MNTASKLAILSLLFAVPAFGQNVRYDNVAFTTAGGLSASFISGATITVCTSAGAGTPCTPKVSGLCLSASDVSCTQPNPTTSDALGNYGFWIQPGSYVVTVTKAGLNGYSATLTLSCQIGSSCTITGTTTFSGPANLNGGGALNGSFSGPTTLTNVPSLTNGKWNGNCIVDGIANATLAAAVTCAGSSGIIEIPMFAVPTLTVNVTIPVGVTLRFDGPSGITTTGFTLNVNGPLVAPRGQQIFFGTGTVNLSTVASTGGIDPQWFPGADICQQFVNGYAAMPANAATFTVGPVQLNCSTGTGTIVNFNTAGKCPLIVGTGGSGTTIGWTGATTVTLFNFDCNSGTNQHPSGFGIKGVYLQMSGANTATAVNLGGTNSGQGAIFEDMTIVGFNSTFVGPGSPNPSIFVTLNRVNIISSGTCYSLTAGSEGFHVFGGSCIGSTVGFSFTGTNTSSVQVDDWSCDGAVTICVTEAATAGGTFTCKSCHLENAGAVPLPTAGYVSLQTWKGTFIGGEADDDVVSGTNSTINFFNTNSGKAILLGMSFFSNGRTTSIPLCNVGGTGRCIAIGVELATPSKFTGGVVAPAAIIAGTGMEIATNSGNPLTVLGAGVPIGALGDTAYGTYRVTADQTITAGASLTAIPGLSWTMPANTALNVQFACYGSYSQVTAAASDSFGVQDVTIAPTNIYARKVVWTSTAVALSDNLPTLASTTATAIGAAFTPSAATTVFNFEIEGEIEQPSNASASVIQVMAQFTTNNGTIKRGTACRVW